MVLLMPALDTSRLDLAQVFMRFPNSAAHIRRLVLADEGFRCLCEDFALAKATLSKLERSEPAEKYVRETADYQVLISDLEREIAEALRNAP